MSDDKTKTDQGTGDGTKPTTEPEKTGSGSAPSMPFAELMGQIDSRIESAVRKVMGGKSESGSGDQGKAEDPTDVASQVRAELAKLNGEQAAKQKEADRDVTINELKEQVTKLSEAPPTQQVSKLTRIVWGGKKNA